MRGADRGHVQEGAAVSQGRGRPADIVGGRPKDLHLATVMLAAPDLLRAAIADEILLSENGRAFQGLNHIVVVCSSIRIVSRPTASIVVGTL